MRFLNRLTAILGIALMLWPMAPPLDARSRKGDRFLKVGRDAEERKQYDIALENYEKALSEDPTDAAYNMAVNRVRFQAAMLHVKRGQQLRTEGKLAEALAEFEKAYAIDPSSPVAAQEIRRTAEMIEREKRRSTPSTAEERALTPADIARQETQQRIASMQPIPELKPVNNQPINLKMNNQPPRVMFETVGKLAGINILFDPDYQAPPRNQNIELTNLSLEESLNHIGLITKSFWQPVSANSIFVTNDNTTKRRDYEEQVMKVFYLNNITSPQELQEILTTVRSVADIQRLFPYNAQNAIIARGEADRIALAEKIIADLDKPKPEVIVDVFVMEANKVKARDLAFAVAPDGIQSPISFNPRTGVRTPAEPTTGSGSTTTTTTDPITGQQVTTQVPTTGTGTGTAAAAGSIPLANLGRLSTGDWSVVLPGGLVQALVNDRSTRVVQSPQLRSIDNVKASLRIGDKVPTATGSFQPGIGGVGINPLVNTQFTFIEVGVNIDVLPKIHGPEEVSLHVEVEISNVRDRINLGGISQPVIGQRKIVNDIRMREGEVNLMGGLMQAQDSKTITGIPGLGQLPIFGRFFSKESIERNDSELLIALVPHIVRPPEYTQSNLRGVAVGNATVVRLNYGKPPQPAEAAKPGAAPPPAPGAPPATTSVPPLTGPAVQGTGVAPATPPATAPQPVPPTPPATAPPPPAGPGIGQAASPPKPAAAAAGPIAVQLTPPVSQGALNGPITMSLDVANANDLFAAPMQIKFDPKMLRLADVSRGPMLSQDGQTVIFTRNILNDSGDATIQLSRMPNQAGVTGSGTLLTMRFVAIAPGETTVSIPGLVLRDSKSQPLSTSTPAARVTVK